VIAGLWEFTGKHGLIRCKVVVQGRRISRADTMGNVVLDNLLLLYKAHVAFFSILSHVANPAIFFLFSCHHDWICPTNEENR
jgi:hypothetical protein